MVSFGMFARVTDIASKSVEELKNLRHMKLDSINIGIETAHDPTLDRMNKGYHASDILEQLSKLDEVGIRYNVFYLNGLGGKGCGEASAIATADVLNRPTSIHYQHRVADHLPGITTLPGRFGRAICRRAPR